MQLIKAPQKVKLYEQLITRLQLKCVDVSSVQLELCNLKGTDIDEIEEGFYLKASTKAEYPQLAQLGRWVHAVFAATYICESAISYMNNINSKLRSTLTQDHLCQLLRIACFSRELEYQEIMRSHKHPMYLTTLQGILISSGLPQYYSMLL